MKKIKNFLAAFGLLIATAYPVFAGDRVVITNSWGGSLMEFYDKYSDYRKNGTEVVIDGVCISACTLVLGSIPPENLCSTPRGIFGFHSAYVGALQYSEVGTKLLWMTYPMNIRMMLKDNGWDGPSEHPDLVLLRGQEVVRECR